MAEEPTNAVDPQRSLKRSLDQLTQSIKAMNKHLESLNAEGQGQYIEGQKESVAAKKIREQSWSVAQAKAPDQTQLMQPGSLNTGASTISEVAAQMKIADERTPIQKAADTVLRAGGISNHASEAGDPTEGIKNALRSMKGEEDEGEEEPVDQSQVGLGWMSQEQREAYEARKLHKTVFKG